MSIRRLAIGSCLALLVGSLTPLSASASPGNAPAFNSEINQLEAASNVLRSINRRLDRVLDNAGDPGPNWNGTLGKLRAISGNLQVVGERVENVLAELPGERELVPYEVDLAAENVSQIAVHISDRARLGFEEPLDDSNIAVALDEVELQAKQIFGFVHGFVELLWDRVIPVRFVQAHDCFPGLSWCDPHLEWDSLLASVTKLNEAFRGADLHFMLKSNDRYWMYNLAHETLPVETLTEWGDAISEIGQAFPIPDMLPNPADRRASEWIGYMSTVFSDPTEFLVWVVGYDSLVSRQIDHHSVSAFPNGGRVLIISAQNIYDPNRPPGQPALSPYHLTHEAGHFFGIRHTWNGPTGTNPYTGAAVQWADLWDLIYCPGDLGFPISFSSWDAAASADCASSMIETIDPSNCRVDNRYGVDDSDMECSVLGASYFSGNPLLKGLSFDLGTPESPPDSFAYGLNVMSYYGNYNAHLWTPGRFSASQLDLIRGHANHGVPIVDPDGFYAPFVNLWSQRNVLGTNGDDSPATSPSAAARPPGIGALQLAGE